PYARTRVARLRSCGEIRAQTRETEVVGAEHELLRRHEKEPAPCPAHHAVLDQRDCPERQLQPREPAPEPQSVHIGGLVELARNRRERLMETEGEVPSLAGEDEQDR